MLYTENKKEKLFLTSSDRENMERMKDAETHPEFFLIPCNPSTPCRLQREREQFLPGQRSLAGVFCGGVLCGKLCQ